MPPSKTPDLRTRPSATGGKVSQAIGHRSSTSRRRESDDDLASLLGRLSTAMLRAPAHATDREIEIWLGRVCQALDVDRAGVFERKDSKSPMEMTHTWVRAPYPPDPPQVIADSAFRSIVNKVMAGESFNYSYASDLPPEMDDLKAWVLEHGPKAGAAVPLRSEDGVFGMVTFGKFRASRDWPSELLRRLAVVAEVFGNAIERRRTEVRLQAVQTELIVASRRNMMSELVGSLAHEINQPLGAILSNLVGLTRLLAQNNPDLPVALAAANNAIEDTKRAGEIVRRIRSMFKAPVEAKNAIDLHALIAEVVDMLTGEATIRDVSIHIVPTSSAQRVFGDRIQLQQCMMNLLLNAFDAITMARSDRREVTIKVDPQKRGWASVSVSDTGTGIDPSIADRLFQAFATTKSNGMGLGLLVTRTVVEAQGGKIWASPNPDCGTTFTFTLPLAKSKRSVNEGHALSANTTLSEE
jgi:signal transduction histidine kinase